MTNKVEKKLYISLLSVIATISVVMIHTNNTTVWIYKDLDYWVNANRLECVLYIAVPLFFMISGSNLINYRKRYDTRTFLLKRVKRTLIPFWAWSFIAVLYCIYSGTYEEDINVFRIIIDSLTGKCMAIYWFFPAIFMCYLAIPVLSLIPEEKQKSSFSYASIVIIIISSIRPFVMSLMGKTPDSNWDYIIVNQYFVYIMLGHLIDKYEMKKKYRVLIYVIGFVGLLSMVIGTEWASRTSGEYSLLFKGYLNVPCLFYSVATFTFFRYHGEALMRNLVINKVVSWISPYTLSIYLIHMYIISEVMKRVSINVIHSVLYRVGFPLIIVPVSMAIAFVIRKIPVIKNICP